MSTPARTAVINLVALTADQLVDMPRLSALMQCGCSSKIAPQFPAVTCTSQANMLTGTLPRSHGIVANGWHDRRSAETRFWQQSDGLVEQPRVWSLLRAKNPDITSANCFWWHAMYADCDISVTPRPMYPADGRKIPDVWTNPSDLRRTLQSELGPFPLFRFWGPAADITSTQWIAHAAQHIHHAFDPTVLFVYMPHLDYGLQKFGPSSPRMVAERHKLDDVAADLIDSLMESGRRVLIVNEYGIMPVREAVAPNRALRTEGWLAVRDECGRELLDAGASRAFCVPDHQVAHVYVKKPQDVAGLAEVLASLDGVASVLSGTGIAEANLDHARSGDLILVADADRWFCHDWWEDDCKAPDYQRTVDIHRKPGYDPRELFLDPRLTFPKISVACRVVRKKLGFRGLMDVIPLDTTLVQGSHGRCDPEYDPIFWSSEVLDLPDRVPIQGIASIVSELVTGG